MKNKNLWQRTQFASQGFLYAFKAENSFKTQVFLALLAVIYFEFLLSPQYRCKIYFTIMSSSHRVVYLEDMSWRAIFQSFFLSIPIDPKNTLLCP